jgi:hypothetical protein
MDEEREIGKVPGRPLLLLVTIREVMLAKMDWQQKSSCVEGSGP